MPRETDDQEIERELPDDQDEPGEGDDSEREEREDPDGEADPELSADESVDDEGGEDEEVDEPARRPTRAQQRIQRQQDALREANARAERVERELAELRGRFVQRDQQETAEQRATRLSLMTPEERNELRFTESQQEHRREMQTLAFQLRDTADKTAFETKATVDPVYRRHQAEVESRLAALRAQGGDVTRENLLKYIVGEKALSRPKGDNRQQRRARESVERERVRPTNGKGDVQTRRGKQADTPRKRLEGVVF